MPSVERNLEELANPKIGYFMHIHSNVRSVVQNQAKCLSSYSATPRFSE